MTRTEARLAILIHRVTDGREVRCVCDGCGKHFTIAVNYAAGRICQGKAIPCASGVCGGEMIMISKGK